MKSPCRKARSPASFVVCCTPPLPLQQLLTDPRPGKQEWTVCPKQSSKMVPPADAKEGGKTQQKIILRLNSQYGALYFLQLKFCPTSPEHGSHLTKQESEAHSVVMSSRHGDGGDPTGMWTRRRQEGGWNPLSRIPGREREVPSSGGL